MRSAQIDVKFCWQAWESIYSPLRLSSKYGLNFGKPRVDSAVFLSKKKRRFRVRSAHIDVTFCWQACESTYALSRLSSKSGLIFGKHRVDSPLKAGKTGPPLTHSRNAPRFRVRSAQIDVKFCWQAWESIYEPLRLSSKSGLIFGKPRVDSSPLTLLGSARPPRNPPTHPATKMDPPT